MKVLSSLITKQLDKRITKTLTSLGCSISNKEPDEGMRKKNGIVDKITYMLEKQSKMLESKKQDV